MKAQFGEAWDHLFGPPVAHRGLWSPDGPPENSLGAFQAACAAGFGVELDVQRSADGEAMVFHDDTLERLTGQPGRVRDHTAADLTQMALAGGEDRIPTLLEALAIIGHRAMVHVELKTPFGEVGPLERRVHEVLIDHNGPVSVIGFNPYAHAWFADHFPGVLRGMSSYNWRDAVHMAAEQRKAFANLEQASLARAHFLALDLAVLSTPAAVKRRAMGAPVLAWTVRDEAEREAAAALSDNFIFEGLRP
jgi:glycerophosphoryl diester phosphodiesterase